MKNLDDYLDWFLSRGPSIGFIPFNNPTWMIEGVTTVVLHRKDQFQVQMFIAPPGQIIPEHTHPNVESFEVYGGGEIFFTIHGQYQDGTDYCIEDPADGLNTCLMRGRVIRVKPDDIHGAIVGDQGAVFYSVQHWLNGVKSHCVTRDYSGKTIGNNHLSAIKFGEAHFTKDLKDKDALSAPEKGSINRSINDQTITSNSNKLIRDINRINIPKF